MPTNASLGKRVIAYLIDFIIIISILNVINSFVPENKNVISLRAEYDQIGEQYQKSEIDFKTYYTRFSAIYYDIDSEQIFTNIYTVTIMLIYFCILPYYFNGQSIGKKFLNIKIVNNKNDNVTINDLICRNLIYNGILITLVSLAGIFILPSIYYFTLVSIMSFIQIILVIVSLFMIKYREDRKGIHDLIVKTKVINIEKGVLLCEN